VVIGEGETASVEIVQKFPPASEVILEPGRGPQIVGGRLDAVLEEPSFHCDEQLRRGEREPLQCCTRSRGYREEGGFPMASVSVA